MKGLLAVIAVLLGGVLALQWHDWQSSSQLLTPPKEAATASTVESATQGEHSAADAEAPPREDYAAVVERPLFLPDRRPPPEEEDEAPEAEEAEATKLDGVDLTAVVITPEEVSAWLRAPGEPKLQKRLLGEEFLGWRVKTIEPALIVLERQAETNEIHLRDYANAPAPIPPTRVSSRGQSPRNLRGDPANTREPVTRRGGGDTERADASADRPDEQPTARRQRSQPQDRRPPVREPITRRPASRQQSADTTDR